MTPVTRRLVLVGIALVTVGAIATRRSRSGGGGGASATVRPPQVEYGRMSDLPSTYRAAAGDVDAFTNCWFTLDSYFTHATHVLDGPGGRKRVRIAIRTVRADLGMKTTIWLGERPAAWLVAHEHGHRRIGERCYAGADRVATSLAKALVGRTYVRTGPTVADAESAARAQAGRELTQAYLAAVARYQRLHQIYDELTSHGTDHAVAEDGAIDAAFARFAAEGS